MLIKIISKFYNFCLENLEIVESIIILEEEEMDVWKDLIGYKYLVFLFGIMHPLQQQ